MINNKMNKKGVGWMAGVLITAIFISSIVLVIVLMGILDDSKIEPPSVASIEDKNVFLPPSTTTPTGTSSGGTFSSPTPASNSVPSVRPGGSGGDDVVVDELASGRWGSRDVDKGEYDEDVPGLFTEKLGLPKFSMDSQLVGIVIIIILVLLVLLRNMQAKKKKKGSRRVRRKSSK
jgi:preprotein translocase subunit SecG